MSQEKWCSVDELSSYLSVRRETIYRWIKTRNLPAHKIGTVYKARLAEIDFWVENSSRTMLFEEEDEEFQRVVKSSRNFDNEIEIKSSVVVDRRREFEDIFSKFSEQIKYRDNKNLLLAGDSLKILKLFPTNSISLIVTDPPYHSTQKSNIMGDTQFKDDSEYLEWMKMYIKEWKRILKPNGSIYCFCSSAMEAKLEVAFEEEFNILASIIWTKPNAPGFDGWKQKMKKEALRQWYPHSERIIFAEPAFSGNLFKSYFGNLLQGWRKKANMTMKDLAEVIGAYGKVNHGGSVANWEAGRNIPSFEQYNQIVDALKATGNFEDMPSYYDVIRAFHTSGNSEFTDIWTFPNIRPYKGKHPAEKPIALLEHIITASSYEGDIVLDCFSGSGSTAVAALKNKRLAISIELDNQWIQRSMDVFKKISDSNYESFPDNYSMKSVQQFNDDKQLQLNLDQEYQHQL